MSAPTSHDPLVVNTRDGVCWERRAVTDSGLGLYAVEGSCKCPPFKMATLAELAERGIVGSADVLPVPGGYPPALPWAALLDDEDRAEFLDELAATATTHASSDVVLAEVEKTCATWRLIAEAQHGHNTAPGPDAMTATFAPTQVLGYEERAARESDPARRAAWRMLAQDVTDGEHYRSVHHDWRLGRDLPETGGQSPDRIVAYRSRDGQSLYCTRHAGELFGLGYEPVTSEDLPDGGVCTYPECGRDVLIDPKSGGLQ